MVHYDGGSHDCSWRLSLMNDLRRLRANSIVFSKATQINSVSDACLPREAFDWARALRATAAATATALPKHIQLYAGVLIKD